MSGGKVRVIFTEVDKQRCVTLDGDEVHLTADTASVIVDMSGDAVGVSAASQQRVFAIDVLSDYGSKRILIYEEDVDELEEVVV